jgi:hypothetical protein
VFVDRNPAQTSRACFNYSFQTRNDSTLFSHCISFELGKNNLELGKSCLELGKSSYEFGKSSFEVEKSSYDWENFGRTVTNSKSGWEEQLGILEEE